MTVNADRIIEYLRSRYQPRHRLSEPFRVLISTILSQRTRDENTEMASNRLFSRYATPEEIARAPIRDIEKLIKPAGFFRAKARHIKQTSSILIERYGGAVPSTREALLSLPGVGQKTANCVLAYGFDIPALPVDVHVHRISNRIGIVSTRSPLQTEEILISIFAEEHWSEISLLLIQFGRDICLPRVPRCGQCGLNKVCEYAKETEALGRGDFALDRKPAQE